MVTIAKRIDENLDFENLCQDIIDKSNQAINDKKVLTHSILLYTSRHGHLARMLSDRYLYEALNEISGRYLNIYHAEAKIQYNNNSNLEMMGFMNSLDVNVYRDRNEYNSVIDKFRYEFNISSNINNPILFFFTSNDGESFDNTYTVVLRGRNADEHYNDLTQIIESVTNAINEVVDENISNQNEILNLAIEHIDVFKFKRVIKRTTDSSIFQILSFLKPA